MSQASEEEPGAVAQSLEVAKSSSPSPAAEKAEVLAAPAAAVATATVTAAAVEEEGAEDCRVEEPMEEDPVSPATVFSIRLKQPRSNLMHKMSVPELCRNFR